jgi:hypothetical protein
VLNEHVNQTKGRRTPQHNHQAEDLATANLRLPRHDPEQSNNGQQFHDQSQPHQEMGHFISLGVADRRGSDQTNRHRGQTGKYRNGLSPQLPPQLQNEREQATPSSAIATRFSSDVHGITEALSRPFATNTRRRIWRSRSRG